MIELIIFIVIALVELEIFLYFILSKLRIRFEGVIITEKDSLPKMDKEGLKKFIEKGYDPELGWVRKPNTSKVEESFEGMKNYHINSIGSRLNPNHEKLKTKIISFGDSYTFCREVNDNETWQYYLADLQKCNVSNFGVGNYGMDQALLRFKRELPKMKNAKLAVMGVVPATIQRNSAIWKHYSEFGNTFGFKPRFILENGELKLIPNPIDSAEKFLNIKAALPVINEYDYFYKNFRKSQFRFPYTLSMLQRPRKAVLFAVYSLAYFLEAAKINWRKLGFIPSEKIKKNFAKEAIARKSYYQDRELCNLTLKILEEFKKHADKHKLKTVFLMMPQPEDIEYIQKTGDIYYSEFMEQASKILPSLDLSKELIKLKDINSVFPVKEYSKSYKVVGGHYNSTGNKLVAKSLNKFIKEDLGKI